MALYTGRSVKKLVARLKEEYEKTISELRAVTERFKEENRELRARLVTLEGERSDVADAFIRASKAGEQAQREREAEAENDNRELLLLAAKCRALSASLQKKYPDGEDVRDFSAYTEALLRGLGEETETAFDMDEVLSPKKPLDLGELCRDLGLMEDES